MIQKPVHSLAGELYARLGESEREREVSLYWRCFPVDYIGINVNREKGEFMQVICGLCAWSRNHSFCTSTFVCAAHYVSCLVLAK